MTFDLLPDELKLEIFNFVPVQNAGDIACVSKDWKNLSEDSHFWKTKMLSYCPYITEEELKYCEDNGGYKQALSLLANLKKSLNNPQTVLTLAKQSPLSAMLFFASYMVFRNQHGDGLFQSPSVCLYSQLYEIAQIDIMVVKSLLIRPKLLAKLPSIDHLAKIAGADLSYAHLILNHHADLIIEMINARPDLNTSFEASLSRFLVNIGIYTPEHARLVETFNQSENCLALYQVNNMRLIY